MKTTSALESKEQASKKKGGRAGDDLDPDFPIEATGGPSDGSGGTRTGPVSPPMGMVATTKKKTKAKAKTAKKKEHARG